MVSVSNNSYNLAYKNTATYNMIMNYSKGLHKSLRKYPEVLLEHVLFVFLRILAKKWDSAKRVALLLRVIR